VVLDIAILPATKGVMTQSTLTQSLVEEGVVDSACSALLSVSVMLKFALARRMMPMYCM
jgi:hypothetical protein